MTRRPLDHWHVPDFGWDEAGSPRVFLRRNSVFSVVRQFSGAKAWHVFEGDEHFRSAHATTASAMKAVDTIVLGASKSLDRYEAEIERISRKGRPP